MKIANVPQRRDKEKMESGHGSAQAPRVRKICPGPVLTVLLAISFSHLLNDTIQAVIPAIYPLLKETFQLTFGTGGIDYAHFSTDRFGAAADRGTLRGPSSGAVLARCRHGSDASRSDPAVSCG